MTTPPPNASRPNLRERFPVEIDPADPIAAIWPEFVRTWHAAALLTIAARSLQDRIPALRKTIATTLPTTPSGDYARTIMLAISSHSAEALTVARGAATRDPIPPALQS